MYEFSIFTIDVDLRIYIYADISRSVYVFTSICKYILDTYEYFTKDIDICTFIQM